MSKGSRICFYTKIKLSDEEMDGRSINGRAGVAIRSQGEVGRMLGITRQRVQQIERVALWKIRRVPELQELWMEYARGL